MRYSRHQVFVLSLLAAMTLHCATSGVPTPKMAVSYNGGLDPRKWKAGFMHGSSQQILMELVPEGTRVQEWDELLVNQVVFGPANLRGYVDQWLSLLRQGDAKVAFDRTSPNGASEVVEYLAPAANEQGIRHFMSGPDGIYMLAYTVRPSGVDSDMYETWLQIVSEAELIQNRLVVGY